VSTDRDVNRIVRSWLAEGRTTIPDRVLDTVLDQLPTTPQRRAWWPARRLTDMSAPIRLVLAGAAAVLVVGMIGITLWPKSGAGPGSAQSPGPTPSSSPTPSTSPGPSSSPRPTVSGVALRDGPLTPGTYVLVACTAPPCPVATSADSTRLTIEVPDGWTGFVPNAVGLADKGNDAPAGAAVLVGFGGNLPRNPCLTTDLIATGSTVDGFANAIATHPVLDATDPVDVSLAGYSGKYIDLRLPADLSSCAEFRPWEPGIYAQGPNHQWHLWILDVAGTRVVVQSMEYPGTSAQHRAELRAIVNSIVFQP
jgi:hypothetical protein